MKTQKSTRDKFILWLSAIGLALTASAQPVVQSNFASRKIRPTTTTSSTTTTTTSTNTTTTTIPTSIAPVGQTGRWNIIFSDEFSSSLDITKWNIANNSTYGAGNNEIQCYMSSNVSVANGVLDIVGKPGSGGCTGKSYTSGWIATGTKATDGTERFSFIQGYVEMRAKAPTGNVFWPALWLQGAISAPAWPAYGEFDITELYPACPNMTTGTLHYDSNGHIQTSPDVYNMATSTANSKGTCNSGVGVINSDYHVYGFNWTSTKLEWYVDGRKMFWFDRATSTMNWVEAGVNKTRAFPTPTSDFFNYAHTISINMAMGGDGPAYYGWSPTNTLGNTTDHYLVDYVRVYKPL